MKISRRFKYSAACKKKKNNNNHSGNVGRGKATEQISKTFAKSALAIPPTAWFSIVLNVRGAAAACRQRSPTDTSLALNPSAPKGLRLILVQPERYRCEHCPGTKTPRTGSVPLVPSSALF